MPTLLEEALLLRTAVAERDAAFAALNTAKAAYQSAARTYQTKVDAMELIQSRLDDATTSP